MGKIKKFFTEFKAFISKGSILDLAVGVVIGGAFSAIITALVNKVLMPVITLAVPGGLDGLVTVLSGTALCSADNEAAIAAIPASTTTVTYWGLVYDASTVNVINWGAFINAVINFIIIAFILFCILKAVMSFKANEARIKAASDAYTIEERKALHKEGHSYREINKMAEEKVEKEAKAKAEADAAAKAAAETEIGLLHDIKDLLIQQNAKEKK
ncbi:MAG: MscL family protein [Bacilli bacterium]|jgi:large conductance mechanosensitive channel|nr:MscL family protein [Bacilli bacterium]